MTKQIDLIDYIFDEQPHLLSDTLLQWMEASTRFTTFVATYRDKIRKKIRVTHEPESILDLCCELEVAYRLHNDHRLTVRYEPYASEKRRGPDFAVTYRANLVFNIEVARMHVDDRVRESTDFHRKEEHILRILLDKLGQMQPGMSNLLIIFTQEEFTRSIDLGRLMQELKSRVERKDSSFFTASRYTSPASFYKDFLRLSGVILWTAGGQLWINKQARPCLAEKVLHLISSLAENGGNPEMIDCIG